MIKDRKNASHHIKLQLRSITFEYVPLIISWTRCRGRVGIRQEGKPLRHKTPIGFLDNCITLKSPGSDLYIDKHSEEKNH